MARQRDIAVTAALVAGLLALAAPGAGSAVPQADAPPGAQAAKKKCKKKKGAGEKAAKKKCKKRKLIVSTVTITNCPTTPVPAAQPVTLTGVLSPDPKGSTPLGAIWESSPAAPGGSNGISFFTAPGGAFSFTFTASNPGTGTPWTTGVRVDFAGDTLFADRRQSTAVCSFTSTP